MEISALLNPEHDDGYRFRSTQAAIQFRKQLETSARPMFSVGAHATEDLKKKRQRWSPAENTVLIYLHNKGMDWDMISECLRGRSAMSCKQHYYTLPDEIIASERSREDLLAEADTRFRAEKRRRTTKGGNPCWSLSDRTQSRFDDKEYGASSIGCITNYRPYQRFLPVPIISKWPLMDSIVWGKMPY